MRVYAQKYSKPQQETIHPSPLIQHKVRNQAMPALQQVNAEGRKAHPSNLATTGFSHDFSRIPVCSKSSVNLQAKLTVNAPGDTYEQEADRIAERVTSLPELRLQSSCACGGEGSKCEKEQAAQDTLQTKRIQSNDTEEMVAPPIVNEALGSHGQPLDRTTQGLMESRFGHDFSRVRVHTDALAAQSAAALNALAYTVGNDIVFSRGRLDSNSGEGRRLLAHELTHVVQQSAGYAPRTVARQPADADSGDAKKTPTPLPVPKCDIGCAQGWGKDTTCSRWGFPVPLQVVEKLPKPRNPKKVMDLFEPCCNSWPWSLEQYAINKLGIDGAASCPWWHGKKIATIKLLDFKGDEVGKGVQVLCSDTMPTGGAGAHYGQKPASRTACTDETWKTDKREVIEMSPNALKQLPGGVNNRIVKVCYSGSKENLCNHSGPGKDKFPEYKHCLTTGCTPEEGIPKLEDTGWPRS